MMDSTALYDEPVHPVNSDQSRDYTRWIKPGKRTIRPVKYYHIDSGHMRRYNPDPEAFTIPGGDMSVPEFKSKANTMINPFPVDVYRIRNDIRVCFLDTKGLEFMRPLLLDMCQDDPINRPTMREVLVRFETLVKCLPWWKRRARVVSEERRLVEAFRFPIHWTRQTSAQSDVSPQSLGSYQSLNNI
ncbi:hypothetical protein BDZ94DRAFT_1218058 [Collybia nuda]|uniref:Uncharacterized protein n=1 Tax=Collybia nuda TaxID=64659 RepID=A0A9P5Y8D6_9AGAR|nr:hypothetical protein BDZ94DRAFT_1218058 [Collybia nuda]